MERREVAVVAALVVQALMRDPTTTREPRAVRDECTPFLGRASHMQREVVEGLVTAPLTDRLVQQIQVMAAVAVMATQLQMAATVVRE